MGGSLRLAWGGESPEKRVYREMASAVPPLPLLCPPPPRCGRCPSLPSATLVGQAPACSCGPWSGEAGVDFFHPAPSPLRVPRLTPPTTASRGRGPGPRPALQLLQGAVPWLPAAWLEVGDHPRASPCSGPRLQRNCPRGLSYAPSLEGGRWERGAMVVHSVSSTGERDSCSNSEPHPLTHSLLSRSQEISTQDTAPDLPSPSLIPIPREILGPGL